MYRVKLARAVMNSTKKMYYILIAVFLLVIIGIGAMLYFSRTFMANSEQELIDAKLEIVKLEETEKIYRENINKLEEFSEIANILEEVVPSEKDQARAVRELNQIVKDNGLAISTISFPSSDLNKKATTNSSTSSTTTSTTTSVSQAKPVKGVKGVLGMDVNIEVVSATDDPITTDQILGILRQIENNRRNMRVNSINFNAGAESINLQVTLFIKP